MGWIGIALAASCAIGVAGLVAGAAIDTTRGAAAAFILLMFGAAAALASVFTAESVPLNTRHWSAWLKPRPIAMMFLAVFAALSVMTDALSLFEPRSAIEREPGSLERAVDDVRAAIKSQNAPTSTRLKLVGLWGEPGCAVTYRFSLQGEALLIDAVRRPAASQPYRLVATIAGEDDDAVHVVGEEPEAARGAAATFTFRSNGATERLTWNERTSSTALELGRCT